ncbi:hypothetical protein B2J93_4566 [Marssonina coronariae]|uniref:Uncharacterized protein n=1 Tax=Diplocarpon coronariae TaxID=2795749 RepID=A0A218ZBZ7_9HELO|nr:hypothetical protein B2J93_4566 [Marssonina coronariae]
MSISMVRSAGGPSLGRLGGSQKSDRTLVLGGPATPASSSAAASPASGIPFAFAAGLSSAALFLPLAAAAPVPAAAAAADPFISPFVSPAPAVAAPVLAPAALAAPPAFAPAVASIFAGGPLAEGVPLGLSQEEIYIELVAMASRLLALARRI